MGNFRRSSGLRIVSLFLLEFTGANAVEFIINHAELSIAFVQENKIPAVCSFKCAYLMK